MEWELSSASSPDPCWSEQLVTLLQAWLGAGLHASPAPSGLSARQLQSNGKPFFSLISVINCIEVITLLNLALSPACLQQGSETAEVSVCFGTFALPLALQELGCSSCAAAELGGRAVLGEQDRWIPASLVSDRSRIFISIWFFPPAVASKVGRCGS